MDDVTHDKNKIDSLYCLYVAGFDCRESGGVKGGGVVAMKFEARVAQE